MAATDTEKTQPDFYGASAFAAWAVCLIGALFFFYEFIQMNVLNSISEVVMRSFHLDAAGLGWLSSTYFYADAFLLIPAGIMLDRFSTRNIILATFAMCLIGTAGFAVSHELWQAELSRVVVGAGNAFCFLAVMRLASRWFPPHRMALVTGYIVTLGMLGGAFAQTPMTLLIGSFTWREAMLMNVALGVVLFCLIWLVVRDYPKGLQVQHDHELEELHKMGLINSLRAAMSNWQNWLGGAYTCLMNLPIILLGALWGSMYLQRVYHLSADQASVVSSMIFIGTIVGAPLVGFISDKIYRRRLPMVVGAIVSLVVASVIIFGSSFSYPQLIVLFFLLGLLTSAQVISYPMITESSPTAISSTALSLASMLIMLGGALFQDFSGWLLNLHWNGAIVNGKPIYSVADYHFAMIVIPISFLVALLAALLIRETNCRQHEEIYD